MLTKENALKMVDYMPDKVPVDVVIEIFYKLERMEEKQHVNKNDSVIDWEELKKEIELWHNNIPPNINN